MTTGALMRALNAPAAATPPRIVPWAYRAQWREHSLSSKVITIDVARPHLPDASRMKLAELAKLPVDWSSYGERPSEVAIALATQLVDRLAGCGWQPKSIVPIAEGGVELRFAHGDKSARIEATNDGELALVTRASAEAAAEYIDVGLDEAGHAVDSFLR